MGYYINLEKISLDDYKKKLETAYLPPSRLILREKLNERFGCLKSAGIHNVKELIRILKKKDKITQLAMTDCLSGNYLTILLRELNSMRPKPNKLSDFPGVQTELTDRLKKSGIENTAQLFEKVITAADRQKLAAQTGSSIGGILELTKLTDLSRIKWVGVAFARMLYDAGVDSVEKAAKADPVELHKTINRLNKEKGYYKGQIGLNDMKIFVNAAKEIPLEIEYQENK